MTTSELVDWLIVRIEEETDPVWRDVWSRLLGIIEGTIEELS